MSEAVVSDGIDNRENEEIEQEDEIYIARPLTMMWWKFKKHKLAVISLFALILIYLIGGFCEFIAPQDPLFINAEMMYVPPQAIRFVGNNGFSLRPFVNPYEKTYNKKTLATIYVVNREIEYPIYFLVHGMPYELWGIFPSDIHLFGVKEGYLFIAGTDRMGRDLFSRIIYGTRISTSIGLLGILISFVIGIFLGGISGYFGGWIDMVIQRIIEFITTIPTIPLWMALSAALPLNWPQLSIYMGIVLILSLVGWAGLARIVRAKFISLREEEFVKAAKVVGASEMRIIFKHMVPSFMSYLIAAMTLSIPAMILGETSLSFIGLGLREPIVSWGVILMDAQSLNSIVNYIWLLLPAIAVAITVLAFNFLGDGLRDAADPYSHD